MAATIEVLKTYGDSGSPTEVVVTQPGLLSTDDNASPISSPIIVPTGVDNYSYECWLRFKVGAVAPANQCTNFKIWSSGVAVGTGLTITINTSAVTTYVTPVVTESVVGTRVDFVTKNSVSKVSVAGTLVNIGDKTDFSVFQLAVANTAGPGNVSYTVNYSYDES